MTERKFLSYEGLRRMLGHLLPGARKIWHGTLAEWEALSAAEKAKYDQAEVIDEYTGVPVVVDKVESGNLNPVTSNAVADAMNNIQTGIAVNGAGMSSTYKMGYIKVGKIVIVQVFGYSETPYITSRVIASGLPKPNSVYADGVCCILNNMTACGVTVNSSGELLMLPVVDAYGGFIRGSFTYVTSE